MLADWRVLALASAFFAALTSVLAKIGVEGLPSNTATFIRTLVIIGFLALLVTLRKEWINPFSLNSKSVIFLILSAFATGLSWICYFRALQLGPASVVAPLDKLSLLLAVVLSVMFLKERLNIVQWLGVIFMSLGALLVAWK